LAAPTSVLRQAGAPIDIDSEVPTGVMRAIVSTAFRRQQIGAPVFNQLGEYDDRF
jgi:hypothetical protein